MLTSAFIAEVQRQAQTPGNVTDAELLLVGDSIVRGRIVPLLRECGSNFLVRQATLALDAQGRARLPQRAVGATLRHVALVSGSSSVALEQVGLESIWAPGSGSPLGYYLDAGTVVAVPPGATGSLMVRYEVSPGSMVSDTDTNQSARVTNVSAGVSTTTVTVAVFGGATANGLDLVSSGPAHECIAVSAPVTGTYVFTNADLNGAVLAGDYLTMPRVTPFVPVPEELTAAVSLLAAGEVLRHLGYLQEARAALDTGLEALAATRAALVPRNAGNPRAIRGGMRAALRRWW